MDTPHGETTDDRAVSSRAGARGQRSQKIVSYGTSSYGYIRCAGEFKGVPPTSIRRSSILKAFDPKSFVEIESDYCIIPPNSFMLARTVEYFRIPRSVLTVCLGKVDLCPVAASSNVTPFEPEWEGYVTLEFSNTTPLPAKIYAGEVAPRCCSSSPTRFAKPPTRTGWQVPGTGGVTPAQDLTSSGNEPTLFDQPRAPSPSYF